MTLVPFSTALLARFPTFRVALVEYWLNIVAQSLYAIATATCMVFLTWVSITLIFLVQLNYVIAPRIPILHRF